MGRDLFQSFYCPVSVILFPLWIPVLGWQEWSPVRFSDIEVQPPQGLACYAFRDAPLNTIVAKRWITVSLNQSGQSPLTSLTNKLIMPCRTIVHWFLLVLQTILEITVYANHRQAAAFETPQPPTNNQATAMNKFINAREIRTQSPAFVVHLP